MTAETYRAPHPIDLHAGARVRKIRQIRRMTQTDLANVIGVKFQQVQKYETGANRISASKLADIARALDVDITVFFPPDLHPEASPKMKRLRDENADLLARLKDAQKGLTALDQAVRGAA